MKITIQENNNIRETEILIVCQKLTPELDEIVSNLALANRTIAGKDSDEIHFISLKEIYYFEAIDSKTFFYTKNRTFETNIKLYQLEEKLLNTAFARVSKSVIVNLKKIRSIRPDENSRLVATLLSDEKIMVSRNYVPEIKKKLGV